MFTWNPLYSRYLLSPSRISLAISNSPPPHPRFFFLLRVPQAAQRAHEHALAQLASERDALAVSHRTDRERLLAERDTAVASVRAEYEAALTRYQQERDAQVCVWFGCPVNHQAGENYSNNYFQTSSCIFYQDIIHFFLSNISRIFF
jgi:hypothetical protein